MGTELALIGIMRREMRGCGGLQAQRDLHDFYFYFTLDFPFE